MCPKSEIWLPSESVASVRSEKHQPWQRAMPGCAPRVRAVQAPCQCCAAVLCYNKQSLKENSESAHYMAVHVKVGCACLVPSQHWAVLVWLATEKVSWQSQLRFLACSQYSFRLSGLVGQYRVCNYGQCKIGLPFWPASQKAACKSLKGNAHLFVSF